MTYASSPIKSATVRSTRAGSGSPINSIVPRFIGEEVYDQTNGAWYKANGEGAGDWELNTIRSGGWRDMLGQITPRANVVTSPTWTQMGTSPFWSYLFALNDEVWIPYHIQHDYAPGTDIFFHVHWTTNGTSTATVKWQFEWCYAKGFNQGAFDVSGGRSVTVTEAASGTAWKHMVSEIAVPVSDELFEVDGLILVHITRVTNGGADNANSVFALTADCHYQSNAMNTKNRTPDFYA